MKLSESVTGLSELHPAAICGRLPDSGEPRHLGPHDRAATHDLYWAAALSVARLVLQGNFFCTCISTTSLSTLVVVMGPQLDGPRAPGGLSQETLGNSLFRPHAAGLTCPPRPIPGFRDLNRPSTGTRGPLPRKKASHGLVMTAPFPCGVRNEPITNGLSHLGNPCLVLPLFLPEKEIWRDAFNARGDVLVLANIDFASLFCLHVAAGLS